MSALLEAILSTLKQKLQHVPAAFLRFCKTPGPLRTVLLVVLALQPLLLFLASRVHLELWNYLILNVVFVAFWRVSVYLYYKAFSGMADDEE